MWPHSRAADGVLPAGSSGCLGGSACILPCQKRAAAVAAEGTAICSGRLQHLPHPPPSSRGAAASSKRVQLHLHATPPPPCHRSPMPLTPSLAPGGAQLPQEGCEWPAAQSAQGADQQVGGDKGAQPSESSSDSRHGDWWPGLMRWVVAKQPGHDAVAFESMCSQGPSGGPIGGGGIRSTAGHDSPTTSAAMARTRELFRPGYFK